MITTPPFRLASRHTQLLLLAATVVISSTLVLASDWRQFSVADTSGQGRPSSNEMGTAAQDEPPRHQHRPTSGAAVAGAALAALAASSAAEAVSGTPDQIGQWSAVMNWPLVDVHMILLHTGKVLMFDAWELGGTASARVWDPVTQTFTPVPDPYSQIFCSGHVQLSDGRILTVGGHNGGDTGIKDTNIFDPFTNRWSRVANMSYARWYPSATALPDGRVVALGGDITSGVVAVTPEIYDPAANLWTPMPAAQLNVGGDYPQTYVGPDGKLFMVSGPAGGHSWRVALGA